jgi:hypothetical protein
MKLKTMMAAAVLAGLTTGAHANLGDTREVSNLRYSLVKLENGDALAIYDDHHGHQVEETLDLNGRCAWIKYLNNSNPGNPVFPEHIKPFSFDEIAEFLALNRLPSLESNFWEPNPVHLPNGCDRWFSRDRKYSVGIAYTWTNHQKQPWIVEIDADGFMVNYHDRTNW